MKKWFNTLVATLIILSSCVPSEKNTSLLSNEDSGSSNLVKVSDLYDSVYAGKKICDPKSGAYKLKGSIGLPLSQNISGAFTKDNKIDTATMIDFLQHSADIFSWQQFIAINWPALRPGIPDSLKCFGQAGKSVWDGWMPSHRIFKKNGKAPDLWPFESKRQAKDLRIFGKVNLPLDRIEDFEELNSEDAPVIDKHGNYVLYEIFYNKEAYDYIVNRKLYSLSGQKEFVKNWTPVTSGIKILDSATLDPINIQQEFKRAYFPVGNIKDSTRTDSVEGKPVIAKFTKGEGAVIIKTAWTILLSGDDKSKYYTTQVEAAEGPITLGLVGMHIAHKIAEVTQWVWSTFEHNANAPTLVDGDVTSDIKYRFYDEDNFNFSLNNRPPKEKYQPNKEKRKATQVVRLTPSLTSTKEVDTFFHKLIEKSDQNSVWLNYSLVGTQWPFDPTLFTPGSMYQPQLLGNAIFETYQQGQSSCMGCHKHARFLIHDTTVSGGYSSDFIYGLNTAK